MKHIHKHGKYLDTGTSDDIAELGSMAVKGIVTVGAIGVTGAVVGGLIGSLPKVP